MGLDGAIHDAAQLEKDNEEVATYLGRQLAGYAVTEPEPVEVKSIMHKCFVISGNKKI